MNAQRAVEARALGQSLWYDNISRSMLRSGELAALIDGGVITGITTNPTIFQKALDGSDAYVEAIRALAAEGLGVEEIYHRLTVADVGEAADLLRNVHDASGGRDGYVSLEVLPSLAHDADSTVAEAVRLWDALSRPNVMIKVPGTPDGVTAFEELTARGVCVNVTLLFSVTQYDAIARAYLAGLRRRVAEGGDVSGVHSVASFFVSRVDGVIDAAVEQAGAPELAGKTGVANSRLAYERFGELFADFADLEAKGASRQRVLWASTSTKNPTYPDTLYVDTLLGPDTVNTLPPATLDAFLDHGTAAEATVTHDLPAAHAHAARLKELGIDLDAACEQLQQDGVASFSASFDQLLASLERRVSELTRAS